MKFDLDASARGSWGFAVTRSKEGKNQVVDNIEKPYIIISTMWKKRVNGYNPTLGLSNP